MKRRVLRSAAFARAFRAWQKTHPGDTAVVEAVLEQLSADATHPSLHSHKLRGRLAGCWACSAGYDLRIVYEFITHDVAEAILLLTVGTHDDVY